MSKSKQVNLIEGPILKSLVMLAMPIVASSFLSTVYNITDMAWIGMLGSKAVAGVGVGGMYLWLSQGLSSLARMGGQVHVAQAIGAGRGEEAREYAKASLQLVTIFGILFAAISIFCTEGMVAVFGLGDAQANAYAVSYTRITCGLVLFSYLTVVLTGIYTAQGDSKTPLKANFIGLAMNMILDPVLILGLGPFPKMEVAGAAVATVTAQCIVMTVMIHGVGKDKSDHNVLRGMHLHKIAGKKYLGGVCRIGTPTAIQGSMYCMISMVLTRMVASFGADAVAVQRVGGQVEALSWNIADGFAAAINAFVAQNYGAYKMDRVRRGYRISFWATAAWGGLIMLMFLVLPRQISHIFFYEESVISVAVDYLMILGVGEAFMCVELMTVGALSGLGKTKLCSIISIAFTGSRIPLAIVLSSSALALNGIWWALTSTSIAKGIVFTLTFLAVTGRYKGKGHV